MFTTELQYIVVRYMLNELADEAANVGIVAVTNDPPRIIHRFLEDPGIKSRNDARVKKDVVDRFAAFISAQKQAYEANSAGSGRPYSETFFNQIREFGAGLVRTNLPRSVLTNDVEQEIETLFHQLVSPLSVPVERRLSVPRDPLGGLRREASKALVKQFRQAYGKPLSRKIVRPKYEVKGAVHRNIIDLAVVTGARRNLHEHLFQHVLLLPDAEASFDQAAALCWRWKDIIANNHSDRELTAVLYDRGKAVHGVSEATHVLKKEDIEVANLGDLPRLVQKLKGQLQLL